MSKAMRRSVKDPSPKEQDAAEAKAGLERTGMSNAETAQYIAEFSAELAYLARESKLDLLAYLLDMARLEAIRSLQAEQKDR
ncbi:MAG: hypothetical protein M3O00_19180 [Pseudomonadota bacterium]|jgi:hypothetical protein|nr:hypothetical protein [Pseudomonadota bacterium]